MRNSAHSPNCIRGASFSFAFPHAYFKRAFTLLEIVIVIAMFALAGGVIIYNMGDFVPALENVPVEKSVERACTLASHSAWTKKKRFYVVYSPESREISVEDFYGNRLEVFKVLPKELVLRFLADPRSETNYFQISQLEELLSLEFNPAGCSTPALIVIEKAGRISKVFQLDPFSGGLNEKSGF